jgi:3-mercaptopyruvate sulfurtransferase SseA
MILIIVGLILIGSATVIGFNFDNLFPAVTATPPITIQDVPRISPDDAKNAFDAGNAIFVDVRDNQSFSAGHIPGALSIPLNELQNRMDEIPKNTLIIPY